MFFAPIQPVRPEAAVTVEPAVDLGEWGWVEAIDAPLGLAAARHEARIAQDAQVARDSRLADGERFAKLTRAAFLLSEHLDDLASGRVC